MAAAGRAVDLNLGPLFVGGGDRVELNLGVPWNYEPPESVIRGLRNTWSSAWAPAAGTRRAATLQWGQAQSRRPLSAFSWHGSAAVSRASSSIAWQRPPGLRAEQIMAWHGAMAVAARGDLLRWMNLPQARQRGELPWQVMGLERSGHGISWSAPGASRHDVAMRWRGVLGNAVGARGMRWLNPGGARRSTRIPWGLGRRLPWIVRPPEPPPPDPDPSPFPPGNALVLDLGCPVMGAGGLAPLNLGVTACYAVRPQRKTYVVINTVSVVRLPDRTPIEVESLGITAGVDTWGYSFDIELADSKQLALLRPTASGPQVVEVNLNGYLWTAVIESYATRREWQGGGVTLSGRSRTALLAAPYAPARAKATTEDRSVAQLVDEELTDTGYGASYDTVDWIVPAGAWFYDASTPLDAISKLAEASGAVVQSDPASLALRVVPRYPASPWDWLNTQPDVILQDDIVLTESLQVRSVPKYDAVVVTGELEGKGVTCRVRRAAEAGTLYAGQVTSPLINTAAAGAERGRNVLGDRGEQAAIDLVIPLFSAPLSGGQVGRVLPLDLVEFQSASGTWHGLCTGLRIDARMDDSACVIEQTITLERHYTDAD